MKKTFLSLLFSFMLMLPLAFVTGCAGETESAEEQTEEMMEEEMEEMEETMDEAVNLSFQIIRSRIDAFGTAQPNIQRLPGSGRIQVEIPGVANPERVRSLLTSVAKLEFEGFCSQR